MRLLFLDPSTLEDLAHTYHIYSFRIINFTQVSFMQNILISIANTKWGGNHYWFRRFRKIFGLYEKSPEPSPHSLCGLNKQYNFTIDLNKCYNKRQKKKNPSDIYFLKLHFLDRNMPHHHSAVLGLKSAKIASSVPGHTYLKLLIVYSNLHSPCSRQFSVVPVTKHFRLRLK